MLSAKRPLMMDPPQVRIKEFEQYFGDMQQLDGEFIRTMSKLRQRPNRLRTKGCRLCFSHPFQHGIGGWHESS